MGKLITLAALSCILFSACNKDAALENTDVTVLDFGEFSLAVPSGWDRFYSQGYDSHVGGVTNGIDTLIYDYGAYSSDLSGQTSATHIRDSAVISGYPALIVWPKKKGRGITGMYLIKDDQTRFVIYGRGIEDEKAVLHIFHSVEL